MHFVESQHGTRTVPVDLIHTDFRFFVVLEEDVCQQLVIITSLHGIDPNDKGLPVFLAWCPGLLSITRRPISTIPLLTL